MALKLYSDTDIQDIADAIRSKNGSSDTYKVSEMASAIDALPTGFSGLSFSSFTVTPDAEYGRSSNGGTPTMIDYFKSLLPSDWKFARIRYKSGTLANYYLLEFGVSVFADTTGTVTILRRSNTGTVQTNRVTGTNASYSFIMSPNCQYQIEVFYGDFYT